MPPDPPREQALRALQLLLNSMQLLLSKVVKTLLNEKSREVCIKARSPPSSFVVIGQATKHTTVKWPITVSTVSYMYAYQRSILLCAFIMLSNRGALVLSCFSRTVVTSSSCASHSGWLMSRTWTTKSYTDKERVFTFSVGNFGLP